MAENSQNQAPVIRQKRGVTIYMTNPSVPAKDEISRARRTQFGNEHRGLVIDGGTGEILGRGGAYMYEFEEVDKERFVKLFLDGVRKTAGLSRRAEALAHVPIQPRGVAGPVGKFMKGGRGKLRGAAKSMLRRELYVVG